MVPFFFHWNEGEVPPLTAVAVNVTEEPEQIPVPGFAAIVTLAGTTPPGTTVTRAVSLNIHPALLDVAV